MWTDFSFVLSQSTRLTDGRTDRIPIAIDRVCISCSAVKTTVGVYTMQTNWLLLIALLCTSVGIETVYTLLTLTPSL